MNLKDELVTSIMETFKLTDTIFIRGQVETAIKEIDPSQYLDFFNQLCGDDFEYKNALDRVEIVSKRFKDKIELPLIEAVKNEAQAISDSLYAKSNQCVDYASKHRDKFPTDRDLFMNIDFGMMYKPESGEEYFTAQELQVIYDLGREWFLQISSLNNFGEVLKAVERSLSKKQVDQNVIAANVRKMISK